MNDKHNEYEILLEAERLKAEIFFMEHPESKKWSRKESGLMHSYLIDSEHHIIRLDNKSNEKRVMAEGLVDGGRIKRSSSKNIGEVEYVGTLVKTFPRKNTDNPFDKAEESRIKFEAKVNLDLGIATGPLIETTQKYYQEMHIVGEALNTYALKSTQNQKIQVAIDLLRAMAAFHSGEASKSKTGYEHNDLHHVNILIDHHVKLSLIDFGYSVNIANCKPKGRRLQEDLLDKQGVYKIIFEGINNESMLIDPETYSKLPESLKCFKSASDITNENFDMKLFAEQLESYLISSMTLQEKSQKTVSTETTRKFKQELDSIKKGSSTLEISETITDRAQQSPNFN